MPRAFVAPEESVVMSKIRTPRLARLIAAMFCAGASLPALPADSHGHDAKPAAAKKLVAEAPAASAADTKPAKPAARAEPPQDPMDKLRERLAEKLGATKAAPSNPNVVRVAARAGAAPEHAPAAAAAAAHAARPAATRPRAAAAGAHDDGHAAHWSYDGSGGPAGWGAMKPEFAKCSTGTRQSPIDIREGIKVQLDPVQFDYRPSGFRVVDNGHTVQVNVAAGNSIEVMGRRYELLQFHFHRPSEERIDGRQFDMVAHLVHKDVEGRLAVVAVLLDRGSAQPIVQAVWNNLPLEKGDEVPARGSLDLNALLPPERSYFTYMGSLTTPPCSEGVLWMVMKQPVPISPEQIAIFSRLYPMNARPIQSASGRLIKESN
jgi:carbonic anhydrase